MGITGFFKVQWAKPLGFYPRSNTRTARIAVDVLSFAISSEPINKDVLASRLTTALSSVQKVFNIERVALFVDGKPTHNLKRAEQQRRQKHASALTRAQIAYVKNCQWRDHVLEKIAFWCRLDKSQVTLEQNSGEADMQIFENFKSWGKANMDTDNIVLSADSDVYFMSFFAPHVTWFIRRSGGRLTRINTVMNRGCEQTRMLKYATLNKTDFYNVLHGGKYDDPTPDAVWDTSNIAALARDVTIFCRDVLAQRTSAKRPAPDNSNVAAVVSVMARRVWFLRTSTGHPTSIDEDATLISECPKKIIAGILSDMSVDAIVTDILAIIKDSASSNLPAPTGNAPHDNLPPNTGDQPQTEQH